MCKWQSKRLVLSMARWQRQIRSCLSVSQAVLNSFVVFVSLSLSRSLSFEVLEVGIYYLLQYIIGMTCWMTCPLGQMPQRFFSLASRKTCSPMFSNTQNLEERWQMLPPASDFSETGLKAFFNGLDCAPSCTITKVKLSNCAFIFIPLTLINLGGCFWCHRGGSIWWFLEHGQVAWWRTSSKCPAFTCRVCWSAQFQGLPLCSCVTWCLLKSFKDYRDYYFILILKKIVYKEYAIYKHFPLTINPG